MKQALFLGILFSASIIWAGTEVKAQSNVGIGTASPNASAILDVNSAHKGVLFPKVFLLSFIDNTTITNPATGLLVYNTNASLSTGTGYYYNAGNSASPTWTRLSNFVLPYYNAGSTDGNAFRIDNYSANSSSAAIYALSMSGNALETNGKIKFAGSGQSPAQGKVLTSDANGNATWEGGVAFSCVGVKAGYNNVPGGPAVRVTFATEKYDVGNNYNNSLQVPHSQFNAPVDGIYHFDVLIQWGFYTGSARSGLFLQSTLNGNVTTLAQQERYLDYGVTGNSLSLDVKLSAGTQVYVWVNHNDGDTNLPLVTDPEYGYFNGRLVMKL